MTETIHTQRGPAVIRSSDGRRQRDMRAFLDVGNVGMEIIIDQKPDEDFQQRRNGLGSCSYPGPLITCVSAAGSLQFP